MGLEEVSYQGFPPLCGPDVLYSAFRSGVFPKPRLPVDYVGNPSVDSVAYYMEKQMVGPDTFREDEGLDCRPVLALLAGSRRQEIKDNLPTMLKVAPPIRATNP